MNKIMTSTQNSQGLELLKGFDELMEKIDRTIEDINKEKVSIALFGAFSDGKSSVVSAITKNFNIKIAPEPTTDKITFYEYGDYFIVDTPGTFSHKDLHDEKTRKYISEANVILFVVDAVNPIKDSHKELVKEVLIDMRKLENTIFVLNKMDNVVLDFENEEEYKRKTEIKKKALLEALEYLNLSDNDKRKIKIVAVSANPNSLGFEYWSKSWNEYMKLSRMENLIREIQEVYQKDKEKIVYSKGVSVILDVIDELQRIINLNDFKEAADRLSELEKLIRDSYYEMNKRINEAFQLYRNKIEAVKQDYYLRLDLCTNLNELSDFVKNYIGETEEMEKIYDRIRNEIGGILQVTIASIEEFFNNLKLLEEFASVKENEMNYIENASEMKRNLPSNLSISRRTNYKTLFQVGGALVGLGNFILSSGKLQIMRGLLHFRNISGLSNFITFTGRGTHMIWASKLASVIRGFGSVARVAGVILNIVAVGAMVLERKIFEDNKAKLREFIEKLFSQINSLEFLLELAGIQRSNLEKHSSDLMKVIENEKNIYQKYYESLDLIFKSLEQLRKSV
ncbi:MAG: LeoA/HP0731 family dynamin-like GTPase [candidate division WOR-3 bacterium]|nr:dynamin family protein [candidate division WOR-3 bacterium]MDW8149982.1 LeoA/HP0731 family dynamin-like GTPase [candidate division WOR-3 bacterium]